MKDRLFPSALGGTVVATLCCVTPLLPWVLAAFGASALTGYLYRDVVLLPVLGFFLVLTGVALWRRRS